jgi:hypothetical protein
MRRNGTAISNHQPGLGLIHHKWRSDHRVASRDLLVNERHRITLSEAVGEQQSDKETTAG